MSRLLFPESPRDFAYRRGVRMGLRATHILTGGILLGGHVFSLSRDELLPWVAATAVTGGLLVLLDLYASFAVLCEVRGLLVAVKILLVVAVAALWDIRVLLLAAALFIGVFGSHMPSRYRHHLVWLRGRVAVDESKG